MKMKTMVTAVVLCAMACISTSVFAEDDFGIESASPVTIADPVNPQPGMTACAYYFGYGNSNSKYKQMTSSVASMKKLPAVSTFVDKGDSFSKAGVPSKVEVHTMMWEGYIKCKRATTYTFSFSNRDSYSFYVNGVKHIDFCFGQESTDVNLKVGWNHVVIVAYFSDKGQVLSANYKPKGSLAEPRNLAPKDLFHDQKPEEDW